MKNEKNLLSDVLYFGYDVSDDGAESLEIRNRFVNDLTKRFSDFSVVYGKSELKGHSVDLYFQKEQLKDYLVWLLESDWFACSIVYLDMMQEDVNENKIRTFDIYYKLAKKNARKK